MFGALWCSSEWGESVRHTPFTLIAGGDNGEHDSGATCKVASIVKSIAVASSDAVYGDDGENLRRLVVYIAYDKMCPPKHECISNIMAVDGKNKRNYGT